MTQNICLTLGALRSSALRTDGDPSGFYRTSQEEQTPNKQREARSTRPEISILPDNVTRIVVRCKPLAPPPVPPRSLFTCLTHSAPTLWSVFFCTWWIRQPQQVVFPHSQLATDTAMLNNRQMLTSMDETDVFHIFNSQFTVPRN